MVLSPSLKLFQQLNSIFAALAVSPFWFIHSTAFSEKKKLERERESSLIPIYLLFAINSNKKCSTRPKNRRKRKGWSSLLYQFHSGRIMVIGMDIGRVQISIVYVVFTFTLMLMIVEILTISL